MAYQLPTFRGYTVDIRLRQFRKVDPEEGLIFIDFNTDEGDELLAEYVETLDYDNPEERKLLYAIHKGFLDSS